MKSGIKRQRGAGEAHPHPSHPAGTPCSGWRNTPRSLPPLQLRAVFSGTPAAGPVPNRAAVLDNKQPQHAELCQDKNPCVSQRRLSVRMEKLNPELRNVTESHSSKRYELRWYMVFSSLQLHLRGPVRQTSSQGSKVFMGGKENSWKSLAKPDVNALSRENKQKTQETSPCFP